MSPEVIVPVPGHPRVRVQCWRLGEGPGGTGLIYYGSAEDLIAAGVATEQMLAPCAKRGPGARRFDADGERYSVNRYWTTREGQPVRRFRVWRYKALATALQLPGAREAIAPHEQARREWRETRDREETEQAVRSLAERFAGETLH